MSTEIVTLHENSGWWWWRCPECDHINDTYFHFSAVECEECGEEQDCKED